MGWHSWWAGGWYRGHSRTATQAGDVIQLTKAAGDVGAQVYMIDRPYRETQNAVARRLVLHPRDLLPFLRGSLAKISAQQPMETNDAQHIEETKRLQDFAVSCPGVQHIIADAREHYMAGNTAKFAVRGCDVLIFCTDARVKGLQKLSADGGHEALSEKSTKSSRR